MPKYPWTCKKSVFELNGCQKSLKPEDTYNKISNDGVEIKPTSMKKRSQHSTINLKNRAQKTENISKNDSQMGIQKKKEFWGKCLLGRLWWSKPFLWSKSGPPALPKCSQWSNNDSKMEQKSPPECENELQKSTLFGAKRKLTPKVDPFRIQARRTARSAYNKQKENPYLHGSLTHLAAIARPPITKVAFLISTDSNNITDDRFVWPVRTCFKYPYL